MNEEKKVVGVDGDGDDPRYIRKKETAGDAAVEVKCVNCGREEHLPEANFCGSCGNALAHL